jgi:hypothetical protein
LHFDGAPAGAAVTVDGETQTEGDVAVDPGRHVVAVVANGYRPLTQSVDVAAGARVDVSLRLVAVRLPTRLQVESDVASAQIVVDGQSIGTGSAGMEIPPGRHVVEARAAGRVTYRDEVNVPAGTTTRIRAHLAAPRSVLTNPWLWTAVGVVVVGGAVATVAGVLSSGTAEGVRPPWGVVATGLTLAP